MASSCGAFHEEALRRQRVIDKKRAAIHRLNIVKVYVILVNNDVTNHSRIIRTTDKCNWELCVAFQGMNFDPNIVGKSQNKNFQKV